MVFISAVRYFFNKYTPGDQICDASAIAAYLEVRHFFFVYDCAPAFRSSALVQLSSSVVSLCGCVRDDEGYPDMYHLGVKRWWWVRVTGSVKMCVARFSHFDVFRKLNFFSCCGYGQMVAFKRAVGICRRNRKMGVGKAEKMYLTRYHNPDIVQCSECHSYFSFGFECLKYSVFLDFHLW